MDDLAGLTMIGCCMWFLTIFAIVIKAAVFKGKLPTPEMGIKWAIIIAITSMIGGYGLIITARIKEPTVKYWYFRENGK